MSTTSTAVVPHTVKEEIKNYLIQGIPATAIAQALGVDQSYVSQLMSEEQFASDVQNARMIAAARDSSVDEKIRRGEETALDRVLAKLPMAGMKDALYVFQVLNKAQLRKDHMMPQTVQATTGTVVEIYLPGAMVPQYVQNKKAEIIEVGGKTMVSAGVKQLERLHSARTQATLPPGTEVAEARTIDRAADMLELLEGSPMPQQPTRKSRPDLADLLKEL